MGFYLRPFQLIRSRVGTGLGLSRNCNRLQGFSGVNKQSAADRSSPVPTGSYVLNPDAGQARHTQGRFGVFFHRDLFTGISALHAGSIAGQEFYWLGRSPILVIKITLGRFLPIQSSLLFLLLKAYQLDCSANRVLNQYISLSL
ncbi:MAG: hypothetical protein EA412_01070 [Chitinophagaceae bacterium]|nr:MAG: hypothetical protein EA412_01070 [Chitinophagaceae bacterium]